MLNYFILKQYLLCKKKRLYIYNIKYIKAIFINEKKCRQFIFSSLKKKQSKLLTSVFYREKNHRSLTNRRRRVQPVNSDATVEKRHARSGP